MRRSIGEMFRNGWYDVSRAVWFGPSFSALRSLFTESFFTRPRMDKTVVNYELARSLYRNDNPKYNLGAGFVRPIIDLCVEYMGIPSVSGTPNDALLNECIADYWSPQIVQLFRDSMRDSKIIVRFRQPSLTNPLFTEADRRHGKIEMIPPEECQISFDPSDPDMIERVAINHYIEIDMRSDEEILNGLAPRWEEHEIIEIITPEAYTFYDRTDHVNLTTWNTRNTWGFVPCWPAWNEYAADMGGGQSDIEPILPFIQAFHDVLEQALGAHDYHSTPKAVFNIKDVTQFLKNNFPTILDESGQVRAGASINWSGRQIFFMAQDEKVGFVEARSVLGDSKTLLEFLLECIAITSETPKWALLATSATLPNTDATVEPFEKKITRKRTQYSEIIVMICKMAQKAYGMVPSTPRVIWPAVRLADLAAKGQAIQQIILAADVASQHRWMSDETVVRILNSLFAEVEAPEVEMANAKKNYEPPLVAPAPASSTQALPPASSNGKGNKSASKKALATTSASKS